MGERWHFFTILSRGQSVPDVVTSYWEGERREGHRSTQNPEAHPAPTAARSAGVSWGSWMVLMIHFLRRHLWTREAKEAIYNGNNVVFIFRPELEYRSCDLVAVWHKGDNSRRSEPQCQSRNKGTKDGLTMWFWGPSETTYVRTPGTEFLVVLLAEWL